MSRARVINSSEWMTVGEAAEVLSIPVSTYRRQVAKSEPGEHISKTEKGYYLIRRSYIQSLVAVVTLASVP
jgi:hypothetical protein